MPQQTTTSTAPSTLPEQSITASLTAEIMNDLDDGRPTLVAYAEGNAGDIQEVTPAQLVAKVAELRAHADRIEALANEYATKVAIPAFVEQYGIELEELDTAKLFDDAPNLAAAFRAFCAVKDDGGIIVAVPKGQAPVERLAAIRDLVLDLQQRTAA
ncbi:hypothetical protein ACWDZW_26785 [Streptomyces coeruleorubidus]